MKLNNVEIQLLDKDILEFKKFIDKFSDKFQRGHLTYNMWVTEHEELRRINQDWTNKNKEAQDELDKTVAASNLIKAESQAEKEKYQAEIMKLWSKANSKFREIEKTLQDVDRKKVKEALKELEVMAA